MKLKHIFAFIGVITCAKKEEEVLGDVTTSVRNVAMDLLDKATSATNGNSVISPISIAGAMFMTAACTKAKKAAEIEILETFYNDLEKSNVDAYAAFNELQNFLQSNDGYTLSIANAIFYQNGFLSDSEWAKKFKNNKRLQSMKPIDLISTNLASESGRQRINSFVNEKTNGKIPEIYKDVLGQDTLIALGHFILHA